MRCRLATMCARGREPTNPQSSFRASFLGFGRSLLCARFMGVEQFANFIHLGAVEIRFIQKALHRARRLASKDVRNELLHERPKDLGLLDLWTPQVREAFSRSSEE